MKETLDNRNEVSYIVNITDNKGKVPKHKTKEVLVKTNKPQVLTVKADSRGYAYLGKLEGAPDFSALTNAERHGEPGTAIQEVILSGDKPASNMLKKGYLAIGPNATAEVEFANGRITVTPFLGEVAVEAPAEAVEAPAATEPVTA